MEYCVSWEDNDGVGRERYFRSRSAAERHAMEVERGLLREALEDFNAAWAGLPLRAKQGFVSRLAPNPAKEGHLRRNRARKGIRDGR
ncbi:MAG TPA: hypothetical protein VFI23_05185 [Rhizomicrobium sp.]|nr:hypothetical protein [Rhizomicrobium sp.]